MKLRIFLSMLILALAVGCLSAQTVKGTDKVKAYEKVGSRTISKVPEVNELEGNVKYVLTDYTVLDMDRYVCVNSVDSLLYITVPLDPGYPQRFFINFTKPGANNLILQGGVVDTLTSSQTKFYFFDQAIPGWRKFSW